MSSGVAVDDACLSAFQDLKLKKKYRYIIYKLSDDNKIIQVEKTAEKGTYDEFVSQLPAEDCRYAVFDVEYEVSASEGIRNKICFYVWAPDASRVKQKMLYASSKDALRKKLVGVACEIQGTDFSEVDFNTVLERIRAI